ncbi:hypothetical protein [Amycolatopsis australiensis]|uniref:Uncharacterized protein n=1 Tax=Amycolatopsis australiensis TaxID=546364 RepID=A0A1K1T6Y1_9PSEU|nr:hypothetical protein [Amycolatopsis australiensis]SFW92254.1 hypothetical protein SAMN04489730_8497 [Amycolatopsis australiensis]
MATQTVLSTALPNGVRTEQGRTFLHLSAFLSPRLTGADTLAAFPAWLDWPAAAVEFDVSLGGTVTRAEKLPQDLRSDLWKKLFAGSAPVGSATAPAMRPGLTFVRSYPVRNVRNFVREQYALMAANNPTTHPTLTDYLGRPQQGLRASGNRCGPRYRLHDTWISPATKAAVAEDLALYFFYAKFIDRDDPELEKLRTSHGLSPQQLDFLLSEHFHGRGVVPHPVDFAGGAPQFRAAAAPEPPNFHSVVGSLGQYPALLRKFGLVRDLRIPLPDPLPSGPTWVSVTPVLPGLTATAQQTACTVTATAFTATARTTRLSGGLLQLTGPDFDVTEVDPDSAAVKLLGFGESVARLDPYGGIGKPASDAPDTAAPPALQSNGFSIVETGRAKRIWGSVDQAAKLAQGATAAAEDLVRGLRIDVWDDVSQSWHSLCRRQGTYTVAGTTLAVADEGVVTTAHTTQRDDPSQTLYLHESLARWSGYSLVAPRPGKAVADDGTLVAGDGTEPDPAFPLGVKFTAQPGSLPRLRFGRTYRFRARTADLAGNGPALGDVTGDAGATAPVKYTRFEPVVSPHVLFRKPRTEGESAERLVIRSNFDTAATGDCQRHLAPVRIAELLAEQHGLFDLPATLLTPPMMNKLAYARIKQKDTGSFDQGGTPDSGGYGIPYYDTDQLTLPYLPDVLSRGAAFAGLPGTADGEVVTGDFDPVPLLGNWPDYRPFRLRMVEGTGKPKFDPLFRVLTVQVPKGRTFEVNYSSILADADIDLLGLWKWLTDAVAAGTVTLPSGTTLESLRALARQGRLWQLTPFRTLTLVHAIKQPLTPPALGKPVAVRKPGETSARIVDRLSFDRPSTGRVDVQAAWTEQVDDVTLPAPAPKAGAAAAFGVVTRPDDPAGPVLPLDERHEFHDTRYRRVTYTPIGTSRFAEYFLQRATVRPGPAPVVVAKGGIVPASDVVRDGGTTYVRGTDYGVDYAGGTITWLASPVPASVEVAYVPPPITRAGAALTIDVPSTARPAAPDIAYVVPTFGWTTETTAAQVTSTRRGNGLRVFLHRPWYSSGDGEQLGVLLADGPSVAANLARYVTDWAQDPAWRSAAFTRPPQVGDFPLAVHPRSGLKLVEDPASPVAVAPHDVVYDAERKLWFCDITFAAPQPSPYTPFVRLALARYQPVSVPDVELSAVVQAQFAQLSPDRVATAVFASPTSVRLTVTGPMPAPATELSAQLQVADPALSGNVAWQASGAPVVLTASATGWAGTVPLPAARGSRPFRVVLTESELPSQGGKRLAYADALTF